MNKIFFGTLILGVFVTAIAFTIYGISAAIMTAIVTTPIVLVFGVLGEGTSENTVEPPAQIESELNDDE